MFSIKPVLGRWQQGLLGHQRPSPGSRTPRCLGHRAAALPGAGGTAPGRMPAARSTAASANCINSSNTGKRWSLGCTEGFWVQRTAKRKKIMEATCTWALSIASCATCCAGARWCLCSPDPSSCGRRARPAAASDCRSPGAPSDTDLLHRASSGWLRSFWALVLDKEGLWLHCVQPKGTQVTEHDHPYLSYQRSACVLWQRLICLFAGE